MKERILNYTKRIDDTIENIDSCKDIEEVLKEHLVQVAFFQHERLIHLLVTLAVAIITIASIIFAVIYTSLVMALASILLIVLLVCYVMHYFLLENQVQKMYTQYDKLLAESRKRKENQQ